MTDEVLLRRARSGDKDALETLVRRYYDKIYSYCFHHVGDRQTAEDLCQETFCSMLEHLEEYRHYDRFGNYLYVIAGNKCKDFFKKKKPLYLEALPQEGETMSAADEEISMRELVHKLPRELEEVVILRFYQDLKYQDIAKILGISSSLVKYRAKKAVALLKEVCE
ncbi:MAG: RNA polymerase sigma factor [Candidatus Gastranaerophilales bacterium]|nr:RNA polymerase sigma factor [Candidatus Gastranaerophilales bacterium]